jgi:hypothetical protein
MSTSVFSQRPKESSLPSVPVYSSISQWNSQDVEFILNNESNLRFENFSITFENNVEPVFTLNKQRWCHRHSAKILEVTGNIELSFDSDAEMRRLWGAPSATGPEKQLTPGSLQVRFTHKDEIAAGYKYSLMIDIPEIYYEAAPANISSMSGRILQEVSFYAGYNRSNGKYFDLTLRNGESGYPNP